MTKRTRPDACDVDWLAFCSTKTSQEDRWAIHYYASIEGHEPVTRRDLITSEPDHPRAGYWYSALQLRRSMDKRPQNRASALSE